MSKQDFINKALIRNGIHSFAFSNKFMDAVLSAMTEYAHRAIEEAAEEVTAFCKDGFGYPMPATVDKQSILKLKEKY